jgi:hypothetical protein
VSLVSVAVEEGSFSERSQSMARIDSRSHTIIGPGAGDLKNPTTPMFCEPKSRSCVHHKSVHTVVQIIHRRLGINRSLCWRNCAHENLLASLALSDTHRIATLSLFSQALELFAQMASSRPRTDITRDQAQTFQLPENSRLNRRTMCPR